MSAETLKYGTRFELTLESAEGDVRAVYRALVARVDSEWHSKIEITQKSAAILEGGEGADPTLAHQLIAIAKTLGKRAGDAPWPRRINRWRQPGVR